MYRSKPSKRDDSPLDAENGRPSTPRPAISKIFWTRKEGVRTGEFLKAIAYQKSGYLSILIVIGILFTGLWPFNFFPKNNVAWLPDRYGLQLSGRGVIVSAEPRQNSRETLFPDRSISLELWLRPLLKSELLSQIFVLHDGRSPDLLMIGQWRSHLVIRSRVDDPAGNRARAYQEIGLENALVKDRAVFLSITSGLEGSTLFLNGQPVRAYPRHRLLAAAGPERVRVILGNSATGHGGWAGDLFGMALYDHALTADQVLGNYRSVSRNPPWVMRSGGDPVGLYDFSEGGGALLNNRRGGNDALLIPEMFAPVERRILEPPWRDFQWRRSFVKDVAVNVAGFVPLGFFLAVFAGRGLQSGGRRLYMPIAMAGLGLSLLIELLQVYLPTRYSQLSDLFFNAAGTLLGLLLFQMLEGRSPRRKNG